VIDKEICKITSDTRVVTRSEALEHGGAGAVLHHVGPRDDEVGLSRNAVRMPVSFLSASKAAVRARQEFLGIVRGG